jgi:hypothetical protein
MRTFFFEKTSSSPTLSFCMKIYRWIAETMIKRVFVVIFVNYLKLRVLLVKLTKFVLEFCGLEPAGTLALVDIATLSCFNHDFLRTSTRALAILLNDFFMKNFSVVFIEET